MKNTKNTLLTVALMVSTSIMHTSESKYSYTGKAAVDHLTKTGECQYCDLSKQDLRTAISAIHTKNNSWDVYFFGGKKNINLAGANLSYTNLDHAKLTDADLTRANLIHANLQDADLTRATLEDAILTDANLTRTILEDTNLAGAHNLDSVINYTSEK